jgi:hypothetical protein
MFMKWSLVAAVAAAAAAGWGLTACQQQPKQVYYFPEAQRPAANSTANQTTTVAAGVATMRGISVVGDHLSEADARRINEAIESGDATLEKRVIHEDKTVTYIYRVKLADGREVSVGSDQDPDPVRRLEHQRELQKAAAEQRGDLLKSVKAPNGTTVYIMKVMLSDGTVATYGTNQLPRGK